MARISRAGFAGIPRELSEIGGEQRLVRPDGVQERSNEINETVVRAGFVDVIQFDRRRSKPIDRDLLDEPVLTA